MRFRFLGGHEDAIHYNPAQHVLSNADYANNAEQIVETIREQHKEGSTFVKMYETGPDSLIAGGQPGMPPVAGDPEFWDFHSPYQYTEAQLKAGVEEAARLGTNVGVHDQGEPGALYAAEAGVASIDHATQLSEETMQLMKEKAHSGGADVHDFRVFCGARSIGGCGGAGARHAGLQDS